MKYSPGLHPHIRAAETVQSLTWTAVFSLLPAVFAQLFFYPSGIILLSALLFSAFLHEELSFFLARIPGMKKYGNFKKGTIVLYLILFFMLLPENIPVPAAAAVFFFALLLSRTILGGQGAETFHPAAAAFIFLILLFQGMFLPVPPRPDSWAGWIIPGLTGLGGLWMLLRKTARPQVCFVYFAAVLLSALLLNIAIHPMRVEIWLLGGFYFAADSPTTPLRLSRHLVFAFFAGLLMTLLENKGAGTAVACALSILTANALTPWLDASAGFKQPETAHG